MNKRVLFFAVMSMLFALRAGGQDFFVRLTYGNTLYFSITDAQKHTVKIVPPNAEGRDSYAGYDHPSGAIDIPSEVRHDGVLYKVTAIGDWAFSGCSELVMVVIPPTVERIEAYAFNNCVSLSERVTLGPNLKYIGNSAFYGCLSLPEVRFQAVDCQYMGGSMSATVFGNCLKLRNVIVDEGVERIPDYAFCGVDALKTLSPLPQSLKSIGNYAFAYCNSLAGNLDIPDRVETIGECAFHQCHSLRTLSLGASVCSIGARAFNRCIGLRSVKVNGYTPADIVITSFSDLNKSVAFCVPCVSKERYRRHEMWSLLEPFLSFGPCRFLVEAAIDNAAAGVIIGNGDYAYGDTVDLMAVCGSGYSFERWSDGNRENPRRFVADNNVSLMARTRTANTLIIYDTLYRVDTVYQEGYKVVYDTVDFVDEAVSINEVPELQFDSSKKRLKWRFSREEKVVSVSLYSQVGDCMYMGDGRKGHVRMRRYPSGVYYVRVETERRIIRCRLFLMSASDFDYLSLD